MSNQNPNNGNTNQVYGQAQQPMRNNGFQNQSFGNDDKIEQLILNAASTLNTLQTQYRQEKKNNYDQIVQQCDVYLNEQTKKLQQEVLEEQRKVNVLQAQKLEHEKMAEQRETQIRTLQDELTKYAAANQAWEAWAKSNQGQQDLARKKNEELLRENQELKFQRDQIAAQKKQIADLSILNLQRDQSPVEQLFQRFQGNQLSDIEFLWETARFVWPNDNKFVGQRDETLKADALIENMKIRSNLDDFFSLGQARVSQNDQVKKMFKVSKTTIDGYEGMYYGEHTFNPKQPGENIPHGKGVFVDNQGWVWIQWFDHGKRLNNNKFITINPVQKVMKISNLVMKEDGSWKPVRREYNEQGQMRQQN